MTSGREAISPVFVASQPPVGARDSLRLRIRSFRLGWKLRLLDLREFIEFDGGIIRHAAAWALLLAGVVLEGIGKRRRGAHLLASLHRVAWSDPVSRICVERLRPLTTTSARERLTDAHPYAPRAANVDMPQVRKFLDDPSRLLGSSVMVLKSYEPGEKGVLLVNYSYVFSLFASLFDIEAVGRHYHIVLEPSWSGFYDPNILCYAGYDFPVFVQSGEPRDSEFLHKLQSNLVPVPVAANWWVDDRTFRPLQDVTRDADLVMVATWGRYKRHHRFFAALRTLRRSGIALRAILIGYPAGCTMSELQEDAAWFGVADQLEWYERLTPAEVNRQFNRAKVNVMWSRREGFNRVVIEGMLAGVPCVMRDGFNYGYRQPYINAETGMYSSEQDFAANLLRMIARADQYRPRQWVQRNMSCERGNEILENTIRSHARWRGERWTRGVALKVSALNGVVYWNPADEARFTGDYDLIRSLQRRVPPS